VVSMKWISCLVKLNLLQGELTRWLDFRFERTPLPDFSCKALFGSGIQHGIIIKILFNKKYSIQPEIAKFLVGKEELLLSLK
jgi:hypothetical protein